MSDPAAPRRRLSEAFKAAAVRSADVAYAQGRQAYFSAQRRSRGLRQASEHLAGRLFRAGQRAIDKSPIPVPVLAKDAFNRMQDALRQLEHVIESGDISTLRDKTQQGVRRQGTVEVRQSQAQVAQAAQPAAHGKARPQARN